jgi:hypothetical protein
MKKSMIVGAAVFLVLAVSSGAFAAKGLLTGADIENGSLTGADIRQGSLGRALFTGSAKRSLRGPAGSTGPRGAVGLAGRDGGANGINGADGARGLNGVAGTNGLAGSNGIDGTNGIAGRNGADGMNGSPGTNGTNGTNGTTGTNGTVTPLWATAGPTPFPAVGVGSAPTIVIYLDVPAGSYVVLAKTQLTQSGAGDSIHCDLKAGTAALDQVDMKTLPALAGVPVSLQAVTTTLASSTRLSVSCVVTTATGSADNSSLIAIPTG